MARAARPPGTAAAHRGFRSPPIGPGGRPVELSGQLTIDFAGRVSWSTHNVSEVELLIYRPGSVPTSSILPPQGEFAGPVYVTGPVFLYQLYDHTSGFRGQLLATAQTPFAFFGAGGGAPGGSWVLDPSGVFAVGGSGVDRVQVWLTYDQDPECLAVEIDTSALPGFELSMLWNQRWFYVPFRVRLMGLREGAWHTLRDDHVGALGDPVTFEAITPEDASHFGQPIWTDILGRRGWAIRPPVGGTMVCGDRVYVYPH